MILYLCEIASHRRNRAETNRNRFFRFVNKTRRKRRLPFSFPVRRAVRDSGVENGNKTRKGRRQDRTRKVVIKQATSQASDHLSSKLHRQLQEYSLPRVKSRTKSYRIQKAQPVASFPSPSSSSFDLGPVFSFIFCWRSDA